MSQPLITDEAVRAAKRCKLAKAGSSSSLASKAVAEAPVAKLEADPSIEERKQPPSLLAPKPEPKDVKAKVLTSVKVKDPPTTATSSVAAATTASKKKPWPEETTRLPFSALSRAEMATRFVKASEHLMTELDRKACLKLDGQEVEVVKATMTEREFASKRHWAAAKDCKKADQRAERAPKNAEEAIAKARECREAVIKDWKDSDEGRTFLKDVYLQASEIGQAEALRKVRLVLERIAPVLSWVDVEEGVKALSMEEGAAEDQVPPLANLKGRTSALLLFFMPLVLLFLLPGSSFLMSPTRKVDEDAISFKQLLATFPDDCGAAAAHDISPHLCVICLLHLANEHGLKIQGCSNMDDLSIHLPTSSQDTGFKLEVIKSTWAGHAKILASTVDSSTCPDGIVCVGGDGIVNEVCL
ncbi:hypothetical protein BVRB_4g093710 [Beta vulgaris subsp. vulgaris]|nr:hypothetical protein BVRB_4g093710 [Beta vulgaris subsp. vulgaris]